MQVNAGAAACCFVNVETVLAGSAWSGAKSPAASPLAAALHVASGPGEWPVPLGTFGGAASVPFAGSGCAVTDVVNGGATLTRPSRMIPMLRAGTLILPPHAGGPEVVRREPQMDFQRRRARPGSTMSRTPLESKSNP